MDDQKYYLVTVIIKQEQENGRIKKVPEKYLVKAYSYTDAEAKVNEDFKNTTLDFSIKAMNDSKIIKIIE